MTRRMIFMIVYFQFAFLSTKVLSDLFKFIGLSDSEMNQVFEGKPKEPNYNWICRVNKNEMQVSEADEDSIHDSGWKTCGWETSGFRVTCKRDFVSAFQLELRYFQQKECFIVPDEPITPQTKHYLIKPNSYITSIVISKSLISEYITGITVFDSNGGKHEHSCSQGTSSTIFNFKSLERIAGFRLVRRDRFIKSISFHSNLLVSQGKLKSSLLDYDRIMRSNSILRSDSEDDQVKYRTKFGDKKGIQFEDSPKLGLWRPSFIEAQHIPGGAFRAIRLGLRNEFTSLEIVEEWFGSFLTFLPVQRIDVKKQTKIVKLKVLLTLLKGSAKAAVSGITAFFDDGQKQSIGEIFSPVVKYYNFEFNQFPIGLIGRIFGDVVTQLGFITSEESPFLLADL